MDAVRVDPPRHARTVTRSRRDLGGVLVALTLGGALLPLLSPDAGAAKKDKKKNRGKRNTDAPPPMEPPMDPPLDPGTPPMDPPPKRRRRGRGGGGDRGGWFQP